MEILEPSITRLSNLEVEHARVDNLLDIYLSITRFENFGAMVELLDQVQQSRSGRLINLEDSQLIFIRNDKPTLTNHIKLVKDNDIGKLDLINHQI